MINKIKLYHGSASVVRIPDLSVSREDVDFGKGFYLAEDFDLPAKWACRKSNSIVNEYELDLTGLVVHRFRLDKEWLDFVMQNRELQPLEGSLAEIDKADVLIGVVADDRLFTTLELYADGVISAKKAVEIMNCMDLGLQYVLKSEKAIQNLKHIGHVRITGKEKEQFKQMFAQTRSEAAKRTRELLREDHSERT